MRRASPRWRLYRHVPTSRWFPIVHLPGVTPAAASFPTIATDFGLPVAEIESVEAVAALPADFNSNTVPRPTPVLTPEQTEDQTARTLTLPTFDQIDTIIGNIGSLADAKIVLARMAKLLRVVCRRTGLS